MGKTRRKFSSEEKLKMVMAVIQDGKAVSDVAQENNVHPNMILNWKKEFLENAAAVFDRHRPDITEKAQQRKIEELEAKLKKKDEVIAEIAIEKTKNQLLIELLNSTNTIESKIEEKYTQLQEKLESKNLKEKK